MFCHLGSLLIIMGASSQRNQGVEGSIAENVVSQWSEVEPVLYLLISRVSQQALHTFFSLNPKLEGILSSNASLQRLPTEISSLLPLLV
jgi:hypothetical protein